MPPGNNLHRVVIYRDGGDKAGQVEPFTTYPPAGSTTPEDLWKVLQAYQDKTGGQVLAIAHNGNLSNGMMFPWDINPASKEPLTREYAQTRINWEPLYEATQIKGDGETHPFLSKNDEFANFERWDKANLNLSEPKKNEMLQGEYARTALQTGLQLEQKLGVNPYKFGMIGSTDSHTSLATADDNNFWGKNTPAEPSAKRCEHPFMTTKLATIMGWEQTASGYAAVWATDNTRAALWDAMKRKETYATTGPRMTVRFFGGWDFAEGDAEASDIAKAGYDKGVPMGGDLRPRRPARSPTFLVAAMKDPEGGNLDRIQIIKGWVDAQGARQEKVYDVAWSGDRKPGADGKLPAVGNTVDLTTATYTNTIGAPELSALWKDPEFDRGPASRVLRARARDPDAALDRVRRRPLQGQDAEGSADDDAGARLHVADLVHADDLSRSYPLPRHAADFRYRPRTPGEFCRTDAKLRWRRWSSSPNRKPPPPRRVRMRPRQEGHEQLPVDAAYTHARAESPLSR